MFQLDQEYHAYRERVLKTERNLVCALGFDFMMEHPYTHFPKILGHMVSEGEGYYRVIGYVVQTSFSLGQGSCTQHDKRVGHTHMFFTKVQMA